MLLIAPNYTIQIEFFRPPASLLNQFIPRSSPSVLIPPSSIVSHFPNDSNDSSVLNLLREHHSGTYSEKRPLFGVGKFEMKDHVSYRQCLSFVPFFQSRPQFTQHPRNPSAITHAQFNPYPNPPGPNADLFRPLGLKAHVTFLVLCPNK